MELIGTMFEDDLTKNHTFKYSVILDELKLIHLDLVPTLNDGIGPHWPCQPDRYCLVREGLSKHITCVFICCFIYPCQNDILNFWPKGGFFYLKPRTALKVRENRDPQMLRNHKPHIKPHLKGTKTVNRTSNRNPKSLKPQPATHWAPPLISKEGRQLFTTFRFKITQGDTTSHALFPFLCSSCYST